jgi:hypothetical protein
MISCYFVCQRWWIAAVFLAMNAIALTDVQPRRGMPERGNAAKNAD